MTTSSGSSVASGGGPSPRAVRIGTSGWSYPSGRGTWNGLFYPTRGSQGFRAADELSFYAEHFDTVEVNSTFYRPPAASSSARWAACTPRDFEFSVKLHQVFTHTVAIGHGTTAPVAATIPDRLPTPSQEDVDRFRAGLDPLAAAGKLGVLLVQFPPSFKATDAARRHLRRVLTAFREYRLAVELRHRTWSDDLAGTLRLLAEFAAAWVQIDEPKFRCSIRQDRTANQMDLYYLRLHGRNAADWWSPHDPEDRYNYLYRPEELQPFAEIIETLVPEVGRVYTYFNNHFAAKAVVNATVLKHQLGLAPGGDLRPELLAAYPELCPIVSTRPLRRLFPD